MTTRLEALDRFLEATTHYRRERALATTVVKGERRLARAFRAQSKAVLRRFVVLKPRFTTTEARLQEDAIREDDWSVLFTEAEMETLDLFMEPMTAIARAALDAGAREAIADLGVDMSFDLAFPEATAYVEEHGAALVAQINETTRTGLRGILTEAADSGWSYDKTAEAINARYREMAVGRPQEHIESRAHMIATTEAGNGYEHGNLLVGRRLVAAGVEMEKSWLSVGDARSRKRGDPCPGNQAAGWIPLDQAFPSGHDRPLAHPACRCALRQRMKPEEV